MKEINKIYLMRMLLGILIFIFGLIIKNDLMKGFGVGYLFCLVFSYGYEKTSIKKKEAKSQ